ncbi:TPA: hypothetical protein ACIPUI_001466 [Citrobacter freundii]
MKAGRFQDSQISGSPGIYSCTMSTQNMLMDEVIIMTHWQIFYFFAALLFPAIGYASASGTVRFSGRIINPACSISTHSSQSVVFTCQQKAQTVSINQARAYSQNSTQALSGNAAEVQVHWLNNTHTAANMVVIYR